MAHFTLNASREGCIVKMQVGVSAERLALLQSQGIHGPSDIVVDAMIDTGAASTMLSPDKIALLNLPPRGIVSILTPSTGATPHQTFRYDVSIGIYSQRGNMILGTHPVLAAQLSGAYQALIGRDILSRCLFVYDGAAGYFSLAF